MFGRYRRWAVIKKEHRSCRNVVNVCKWQAVNDVFGV